MLSMSQLRGGGGPAGPLVRLEGGIPGRGRGGGVSGTWNIALSEGCTVGVLRWSRGLSAANGA